MLPIRIRIRDAGPADIDHILRHRVLMFEEMGEHAGELEHVRPVSERYFAEALRDGGYRAWLAETEDGRIVAGCGVVVVRWPGHPRASQPRRAWILNMYTEPEFRRRGIARKLLQSAIEWCRAEGFPSVSLHASSDGRPLYDSLGFRPTNEMRLRLG